MLEGKLEGKSKAANTVNRGLMPLADVVFGVIDFDARLSQFDKEKFRQAAERMCNAFPDLKIITSTLRDIHSASRHDLSAVCYTDGKVFKAKTYENLDVLDRVGSGDAFAAGFIYGLLAGKDFQYSVECGASHAALAMTTPGDNSMATLAEVESLMQGDGGNINR